MTKQEVHKYIIDNQGLIYWWALNRYKMRYKLLPVDDLVQAANMRLLKHLPKWNKDCGWTLKSHAVFIIRGSMWIELQKYNKHTNYHSYDADNWINNHLSYGYEMNPDLLDYELVVKEIEKIKNLKHRKIIKMYYGVGGKEYKAQEIQDQLHCTNATVYKAINKNITKIKNKLNTYKFTV